jgi:ABC-type nitrate/sulfonate/bicarbonate transport system substrate-binding protein
MMKRDLQRGLRLGLGSVALAVLFAAPAARADDVVRVANVVPTGFTFTGLQIGIDLGIFKKHGLDVRRFDLAGSARGQQALVADSVDIELGAGPELASIPKGAPVKAVAVLTTRPSSVALTVAKDGPVKTVADLKGRKVTISTVGGLSWWLGRQISKREGWGPDGIDLIGVGAVTAQISALRTHQADGAIMDIGSSYKLEEAGEGRILLNFGSIIHDWINQVAIVRDAYAAAHPDVVRRFLAGWFETIDWMAANREKTAEMAGRAMNVSTAIAARSYDDIMPTYSRDGRFSPAGLKLLGEALVETGAVKTVPDLTTLYTEAYLPKAKGK